MLFWILVAILTAAVAVALLLPLLRADGTAEVPQSHDVEVYRDQLDELKRDERSGLISCPDAEFARAEVARRLMAAQAIVDAADTTTRKRRSNRLAQAAVIAFLPVATLCLYLTTGSPDVPDAPLSARLADSGNDLNLLIARAEQQLVKNPKDGAGWDLLAPIYYRSGRIEDAAAAFQRSIELLGPSPARLGGYAESLIALSGGLITQDAQAALQRSMALQPNDPRAEFYLAVALEQEGKTPEALSAFNRIVATSPKDAPWLPLVGQHIESLQAKAGAAPDARTAKAPGNPTEEDVAAAQDMNAGDRRAMIEGMVASLEARLKNEPANFEGWMRIVRSYSVLGDKDKARDAVKQGLAAFPAEGQEGRQLLALAKELGLSVEGEAQ